MNIGDWLKTGIEKLTASGIGTARLDCLVLLEDATGRDRSWVLAHPEMPLSNEQLYRLENYLTRRIEHEPLAYIRGKSEFFGREFNLDHQALDPRPETEIMIDLLKELTTPLPGGQQIVDVGTGSGVLAVTAKLELNTADIYATEIDSGALKVAEGNAKKHDVNITFLEGDLLEPLAEFNLKKPVLLCNLPYVPTNYPINRAAGLEPKIAIFAGEDGLDLYRRLFKQIDDLRYEPRLILTESLPPQHEKLKDLAGDRGYRLKTSRDLIQAFCKR